MKSNTKKRGLFIATAVLLSSMMNMPPASADEAHATVDTSTIVLGSVDGTGTVKTLEALGLQINGKSVARYVRNPAKHWNPAKAKKVPFAKNYYAGVKSGKPFRLKKGQKFPDTYIGMAADMTEYDMAVKNRVKNAWQLFDFKNGQVRNRGFWTGKKWVGDCVNPKPSSPPTVTIDQLHIVKQFNGFTVNVMGSLSLWATTSGMVEVNCGSSWAKAQFSANADAELEGSVTIKARSRTEALIKGAEALVAKYRNSEEATLKLKESAAINLAGSAEAWCESNNPQPTYEAPVVSATPSACVDKGQTGYAVVRMVNNNTKATPASVTMTGKTTQSVASVAANGGTASVTFTGLVPGTAYSGTVTFAEFGKSTPYTVTVAECPPPTTPPGAVVNEVNDVLAYNSRPVSFTLTGVPGETLEVTAYAKHGGTISNGKTQSIKLDSHGNATGSLTFTAGEVPQASLEYYIEGTRYTIAAGYDVIWLQVRDPRGKTVWAKSNDFEIRAVPPESE